MKKSVKLLSLVMALLLVLCSCGEKEEEFNYSKGINNDGFWEGVKATDFVQLPDLHALTTTDEDVDNEIALMMSDQAYMKKTENKDRAAENLDTVNIDYVGSIDGVEFDGGNTQGNGTEVTIGVTSYIDDFLEQIIGHKAGDSFDIEVTFPDPYLNNTDLSGKDAVFKTTLNAVYDFVPNELNDAFVTEYLMDDYNISTVAEYKALMKENLVYQEIFDNAEFGDSENLPEIIVSQYMGQMKYQLSLEAAAYGMKLDDYIAAQFASNPYTEIKTYEDFENLYIPYAESAAQEQLMLQAVAETENIKITDEDLNKLFKQTEESYAAQGATFNKDDLIKLYGEPYIRQMALFDKVQRYLGTL